MGETIRTADYEETTVIKHCEALMRLGWMSECCRMRAVEMLTMMNKRLGVYYLA